MQCSCKPTGVKRMDLSVVRSRLPFKMKYSIIIRRSGSFLSSITQRACHAMQMWFWKNSTTNMANNSHLCTVYEDLMKSLSTVLFWEGFLKRWMLMQHNVIISLYKVLNSLACWFIYVLFNTVVSWAGQTGKQNWWTVGVDCVHLLSVWALFTAELEFCIPKWKPHFIKRI